MRGGEQLLELTPSQKKTVRHQFDSFCRKVLREEARDYERHIAWRSDHEVSLSELSEEQERQMYVLDEYPSEQTHFHVQGYDVAIENEDLANALTVLPDDNLVVALPNGRPCEETVISNAFRRLKRDAQLPDVVFHSLRHSSTTYKLKLNHGDIKATQGDTGHSQADMVTKVYAHILDEDRKVNAQKFESAFYANPDLRGVQAPAEPAPALDVQSIILQLQQSPELLSALTSLISNQGCK